MSKIYRSTLAVVMVGLSMVAAEIEGYAFTVPSVLNVLSLLLLASVLSAALTSSGRTILKMLLGIGNFKQSELKQKRLWGIAIILESARQKVLIWSGIGFAGCMWAFMDNFNQLNYFGPGLTVAFMCLVGGLALRVMLTSARNQFSKAAQTFSSDVPYDARSLHKDKFGPDVFPIDDKNSDVNSAL